MIILEIFFDCLPILGTILVIYLNYEKIFKDKIIDRINNTVEDWWQRINAATTIKLGQKESKIIVYNYEKIKISFYNKALWATNLSMLLSTTAFLIGSILFVFKTYSTNLSGSTVVGLLIDLIFIVVYIFLFRDLRKGLLGNSIQRAKILFNWLLRYTYLVFLRDTVIKPFLNWSLDVNEGGFPHNWSTFMFGISSVIFFEIALYYNKKNNLKHFILGFLILTVFFFLSRLFHNAYFLSPLSDIYFGLNVWGFNLLFDYFTIFLTIKILKKIAKSKSNWKNAALMFLDLAIASILAFTLFIIFPLISTIVNGLVYHSITLSLEDIILSSKILLNQLIYKNRYLHFLYSLTTFIPTLLFISFIIVTNIIRFTRKKIAKNTEKFHLKTERVLEVTPSKSIALIFCIIIAIIAIAFSIFKHL